MRHSLRLLTLAALLCCWSIPAFTQTANSDSAEVMRQLLALPAPPPRQAQAEALAETEIRKIRPNKFFDKNNPPPDDAPLEDLRDYWQRWADAPQKPVLSDVVKQRLLDALADDVKELPQFVSVFSSEESAAKRIKELFDKASDEKLLEDYALEKIKKWLLFNSKYFLTDLFALANKVKDDEKGGYVDKEEALVALVRVDWQTAEPLVNSLAGGNQPRSRALALTLLYQQAIDSKDSDAEDNYRSRLRAIASDRNAPATARDTSIEALSLTEWSGRDDWYISLLADDSLRECTDGHRLFHPLTTLFNRDAEKWIPVMTRLVESKDRAVQQAAASCLVIYATSYPRRDAILPVLRWLSDPDWLDINGTQRAWFMQKMDQLDMPESVPGLIWIVENEEDHRRWAARTLAHYKDPRAVPVLRKALLQSREDDRGLILEGLVASGGISDAEGVAALEAYAAKRMTSEGREQLDRYRLYTDEKLPLPISIGRYLATIKDVPESLARSVLARAASLKKTNPALAEVLLAVANQWKNRQIDLDMIQRIASGTADANTISTALERQTNLRENLAPELQMLLERDTEALGIGVTLLNDPQMAQTILTANNQPAQIGLLAAARLSQTQLPVALVGRLLPSKNPLLALAAKRYLLAEDSKDARKLLWEHHPDQAFVTGWRENIPLMGGNDFEPMAKIEEKLRAELFKEEGPLEIFSLIGNSEYRHYYVLRIYANKAVYTHYEDTSRYRERVISPAELAAFKQFVATAGFADLGPQFGRCHHNCFVAEFVGLKKNEAWRVFSHGPFDVWLSLLANFDLLGRGDGAQVHYDLEKEIKGLEVLYADANLLVKDVWQSGDEIRIFVERPETEEERKQRYSTNEEEEEAARAERRQKELALQKARFSWRRLTGSKAGAVVAQPDVYTTFDESNFPTDDGASVQRGDQQARMVNRDTIVITRNFKGLWKQVAGRKAVRIGDEEAAYANPIVTPDGKWVVLAKTDTDWSSPNYIVRFNLQTGQEFRVKLEPEEELNPIAFLPFHDRVLVRRAKPDYDIFGNRVAVEPPEYYLLDAATGVTQKVSGEFAPLRQEGERFLQPTLQPHEFWAAIPDDEKHQTRVGRYNLKDFSFKQVLVIPQISFESVSMWVDENRNKLYFVYRDQLLSLPLKPVADTQR